MKVAYFTAGTVGAGHLVRGIAVGKGLERAGFRGAYRMFGPPLPFPLACRREDYQAVEIFGDRSLRDRRLAPTSDLARRLTEFAPDLLVVDLFWAPLYWLLPALGCAAWLLVRTCPPVWLVGPPEAPFPAQQFDRIVGIEPVAYPAVAETIDPIVVANPDELRPAGDLRQRFGIPLGGELVVVLHAGERGEAAVLRDAAAAERPLTLDLFEPGALFPAAVWLSGADRIVSGAGYNAYWEARWLGHAGRTTFVPFRRSIDDQARRLTAFGDYSPRVNGADTLAGWIVGSTRRRGT
ncbi:MAG TPA: hypothetical protein VOA87_03090 [Thermoanaerobaculia bacterium]|nr:hypothetical protein [Thermoanaerobaculia bacterium]